MLKDVALKSFVRTQPFLVVTPGVWKTYNSVFANEARKRGLSCGVGQAKAVPSSAKLKNAFTKRIKLERQQMQYAP
jgi:hypothetical protein